MSLCKLNEVYPGNRKITWISSFTACLIIHCAKSLTATRLMLNTYILVGVVSHLYHAPDGCLHMEVPSELLCVFLYILVCTVTGPQMDFKKRSVKVDLYSSYCICTETTRWRKQVRDCLGVISGR